MKENIKPATGRLGVLVVGVGGAVATTMITGTLAARKGLAKAIGSIAQMATMRMQDGKEHLIKDVVPLVDLNDIVFGGWDIFADDAYEAAMYGLDLELGTYTNGLTTNSNQGYDAYYLGSAYLKMIEEGKIPMEVVNDKAAHQKCRYTLGHGRTIA